jgi:hypothetical protein
MSEQPTTIVAVVNDEPTADPIVQRATELGFEGNTRIVLYNVGARATPFESPLPTEFASHGPDEGVPPLLTAEDLEAAGQAPLARRVRALSEAGIDAYGWLPETDDLDDLAEYARSLGAKRVLASTELDPSPADLAEAGFAVETVSTAASR